MGLRFSREGAIRLLTILGALLIEAGLVLFIMERLLAGLICLLPASAALLTVAMMFREEKR